MIKRICINCFKYIPNSRQKRAKTCSIKCMHDWKRLSLNERKKKLEKWKNINTLK